jgi:DMSO/TMAO reductase YedYZ molybdopterin-dependent catalytic subunit
MSESLKTSVLVDGEVAAPREFDFAALAALPEQVDDVAALVPGREGGAVRLRSLLAAVRPTDGARWATLHAGDGRFSISVPLEPLAEAVLVYRSGDGPLPPARGGPVRFLIPGVERCGLEGVDACANVKGVARIRLTREKDPAATHHH